MSTELKIIIWLVGFILFSGGLGFLYNHAQGVGRAQEHALCEADKKAAADIKVETKVKQDEIRNHRPDTNATVRRLLAHSF